MYGFGTDKGISVFSGIKWQQFTVAEGLPANQIYAMALDDDNSIWVGTAKGIAHFTGIISEIRSPEQNGRRAQNFVLQINYPNPFNNSTTIPFTLGRSAEVQLAIYDLQGRTIKNLVHKKYSKGLHQVIWNGSDMQGYPASSGIYFIRMLVSDKLQQWEKTRKIVLIK
jgi:hypothetical protein